MNRGDLDRVIALIEPLMLPLGYHCLDVTWDNDEKNLTVFIDSISGDGVDLDDCLKVNRAIGELEALDDMIEGEYALEVSSPGADRPLRLKEHFDGHIGETVEVRLAKKVGDRVYAKGKLISVSPEGEVHLDTNRGEWVFPLDCLQRASLVYSWDKH